MTGEGWRPDLFLRDVGRLYGAGGIVIRTPIDAEEGRAIVAETVIQPDGDVIVKMDPAIWSDPNAWQRHSERVHLVLYRYRRGMRAMRMLTHWTLPWLSLSAAAASWVKDKELILWSLAPVVLSVGIRLAVRCLAKKLIS